MDSSVCFDIVHCTYLGCLVIFFQKYCILLSKDLFHLNTNTVDPDELQHYAAFHQGLHFLHLYLHYSIMLANIDYAADGIFRCNFSNVLTRKASLIIVIICSRRQFSNFTSFSKITNKAQYFMRIVCWQTILMKYCALFFFESIERCRKICCLPQL